MKFRNTLIGSSAALLLCMGSVAYAATDDESATKAREAELQARLEAEYKQALSAAEQQRLAAEASIEKAREQLQRASRQKELSAREFGEVQAVREAEMAKMHEELNQARRQLQETSREIARVNREVARARSSDATVVVVTATGREAEDMAAALPDLLPAAHVAVFPSWETLPHERLSPSSDTVGRRVAVMHRLAHPDPSDPPRPN